MGAITDLWNSERGFVAVALIIGATVLAALGTMTVGQWTDYSTLIFGIYVGGKTVTGAVQIVKNKTAAEPTPPAPPSA